MVPPEEERAAKAPLVLIVGNSGSGKDSVIRETARMWPTELPPLMTTRRYITRPPHESEPFLSVTQAEFEQMRSRDCFCLTWTSYGMAYGVPKEILLDLDRGKPVLVNVSRSVIQPARDHLPGVRVAYVHVPLAVSIMRIQQRGREAERTLGYRDRIRRAQQHPGLAQADVIIDNSGSLDDAADQLCTYIQSQLEAAV
jgi:ribose 1,5-bisphosphokinase